MDASLITLLGVIITAVISAFGILWREVNKAKSHHAACQKRLAKVEVDLARITILAETKFGEDFADAVIYGDAASGMIIDWNEAATLLFEWNKRESLGKPITRLIPQRYRERHITAVSDFLKSGKLPRRGPHKFYATRKDGKEIPIIALYAGWEENGKKVIAAYIRERHDEPPHEEEVSNESAAGR